MKERGFTIEFFSSFNLILNTSVEDSSLVMFYDELAMD